MARYESTFEGRLPKDLCKDLPDGSGNSPDSETGLLACLCRRLRYALTKCCTSFAWFG